MNYYEGGAREGNNFSEETELGVTVVEEDEGSEVHQILPSLSASRYLLTFKEGEILYLLASLTVVEEELGKWGRGGGGGRVRPRIVTINLMTIRRVVRRLVVRVLHYRE